MLLTGSSSLKAKEKKSMKSTADVLVMVYLKIQNRFSANISLQNVWTTNLQTDSDEEQTPVRKPNIQCCGQSWVTDRETMILRQWLYIDALILQMCEFKLSHSLHYLTLHSQEWLNTYLITIWQ